MSILTLWIDENPLRTSILEKLVVLSFEHYEAVNEWQALEDSLEYLAELIEDTHDDDYTNSARLSFLYARCLRTRFMRGRNDDDLENAITYAAESTERTLESDGRDNILLWAERQSCLWLCLFTKVHQLDACPPETLDKMMDSTNTVVERLSQNVIDGTVMTEAKSNLGLSFQIRWDQRSASDDLFRSVRLGYEVIDLLPPDIDNDTRINALSNLAFRLQRVHLCQVTGVSGRWDLLTPDGKSSVDEAFKYIDDSIKLVGDRKTSGMENALTFVTFVARFPPEHRGKLLGRCYPSLKVGIQLLQEVARLASPGDLQDNLSTFYGLARYAAAAAIETGADPYDALIILEEARGVAMSSQFESQYDHQEIALSSKELVAEHTRVERDFRSAIKNNLPLHQRVELGNQLQEVRNRIGDYTRNSLASSVLSREDILKLARDGEVIVVNITDIRSDAIIITKENIFAINLPNLSEDHLSEASWEIQTRIAKEENQELVFSELYSLLHELLRKIWRDLAKPVLEYLGYKKRPTCPSNWPRVWWVPTGVLALYPIHASGLGLQKEPNTMNRVISSYSPSLRALMWSRERYEQKKQTPAGPTRDTGPLSAAILSMNDTPGRQPLELSSQEAAVVAEYFPGSERLEQPNTADALKMIAKEPPIIHISCHGETDYDEPSQSKLLTTDWQEDPLTVSQVQLLTLRQCFLAFLSVCFTANAGVENLQDEMVHPASALQFAGVSSIVGSLWYVGEEAALAVVARFYERLSKGDRDWGCLTAEALHFAVLNFRESTRTAANRMRGDPVLGAVHPRRHLTSIFSFENILHRTSILRYTTRVSFHNLQARVIILRRHHPRRLLHHLASVALQAPPNRILEG